MPFLEVTLQGHLEVMSCPGLLTRSESTCSQADHCHPPGKLKNVSVMCQKERNNKHRYIVAYLYTYLYNDDVTHTKVYTILILILS